MKAVTLKEAENLLQKKLIKRDIHKKFYKDLSLPETQILYGPRQVGKSTEIALCMRQLVAEGQKDVFYFNLDFPPSDFEHPERLLTAINANRSAERAPVFVFMDEAQRLKDVGLFVKYLYDKKQNIKFVLTGSASLNIRSATKEALTGRKLEYFLPPLSLKEIFKDCRLDPQRITAPIEETETILNNYLLFGGYPEVFAEQDIERKKRKLREIADTYLVKDIATEFNIRNKRNILLLASFLGENIGNLVSKDNISMWASVGKYEVEKIINALEKSFILWLARPFAKDKARELVHRPKAYFHDLGIRNAILKKLSEHQLVADKGKLFENAVGLELAHRYGRDNINYWRTIGGTEIDFIVTTEAGKLLLVEAKFSKQSKTTPKNIKSFQNRYQQLETSSFVATKANYWKIFS